MVDRCLSDTVCSCLWSIDLVVGLRNHVAGAFLGFKDIPILFSMMAVLVSVFKTLYYFLYGSNSCYLTVWQKV